MIFVLIYMQLRRGFSELLKNKVLKEVPPLDEGFISKILHRSKTYSPMSMKLTNLWIAPRTICLSAADFHD